MTNPLHIIIDGADKRGKTTVIKLLSEKLKLPVIKMPDSKEFIDSGQIERVSKFFNEIIVQFHGSSFILDRGFTSSVVYSRVFNRPDDLSYISEIENVLEPVIFILTGQRFEDDDVYSHSETDLVNEEDQKLAQEKDYHLISNVD